MAEKNMNAKISVEFEETANRQQLSSGDSLPTLFGKTKKFFSDLKPVALSGSYNDLIDIPKTTEVMNTSEVSNLITITDAADAPLISLTAYGRSWQDERIVNIAGIGIEGHGIPVLTGSGNYTDSNGQEWVCDELVVNVDGTGKIVNRIKKFRLPSAANWTWTVNRFGTPYTTGLNTSVIPEGTESLRCLCTHFIKTQCLIYDIWIDIMTADFGGDATAFKEFLSNNDVYTYYPLATQIETELTAEQIAVLQPLIDKYGAFTAYFMSTQDGTPTPENPVDIVSTADLHRISIPIESIGDSGSLAVTTCGKNLIKYPYYSGTSYTVGGVAFTVNSDKSITVSGTSTTGYPTFFLTGKKGAETFYPEGTYIVRGSGMDGCNVMFTYFDYSKNKYVDLCHANIYDQVITIPEGGIKAWVQIQVLKGSTVNGVIYPQLEKGNILTDYEPYKSTTATITTALPLRGIPVLTGDGNYTDTNGKRWVCDELIVNADGTGKIIKRITSVTLDGSEDANIINGTNGENFTSFGILDVPAPLPYTSNILCNITDAYNMGYSTVDNVTVHIGNALNILFGNNLQVTTIEDVKQWLTNHSTNIIYEVKEPTEIELTVDEVSALLNLRTYDGVTNIFNSGNADMFVKYWCDDSMSALISTKANTSDVLPIAGGTMQGTLVAQSNTNYTNPQVRNVSMSTETATGGNNGQIHFQYV